MAIVTISRELGSLGTQIAESVADQLGAHAVDKEVLAEMARQAGVSVDVMAHTEEQLLDKPIVVSEEMRALMSAVRNGAGKINEMQFLQKMVEAIQLLALQDNVVFVGRGAQLILKDHPDALHVHLYANAILRAQRIQARRQLATLDEATRIIQQADEERRNWFRLFFQGVDWKNARHYHLMIDTGRIPADVAVTMIMMGVQSRCTS